MIARCHRISSRPSRVSRTSNFQEVVGYTINDDRLRNDKPPFDDVNIRKAVCYATPLQAIMENIVGVTGVQSRNTTVPPNMPGSASGRAGADSLRPGRPRS